VLGWKFAEGKGQLFGAADQPISWISMRDVAEWSVVSLEAAGAANQAIPLGGPRGISGTEAHKIFEQVLGKNIKVTRIPSFVPKIATVVLKPFNPKLSSLMALGVCSMNGDPIDMTKARSIAKVQETSLEEYARGLAR
jgi:uncharacterized protein YbjT (DUF2867 family)